MGPAQSVHPSKTEWAIAVPRVQTLLASGSEWLRQHVASSVAALEDGATGAQPEPRVHAKLEAYRALAACRKDLAQRNANPQMVAERALLAMRRATGSSASGPGP